VMQARPTKSLTLHLQQVGRALRRKPYPAILLDLCGNLGRLGLPDHPHEWTLQGRPKTGRGGKGDEGPPTTRRCTACDLLFPVERLTCPHCGEAQLPAAPGGGRKVEEIEGELREIDREQARRERLREQAGAQTLDQLIELGKAKGYKKPEAWANHVINARMLKGASRR
jgi:DNA repair protein RadD